MLEQNQPINVTQTPWFTLAPWQLLDEPHLRAITDYLNQVATQQLLTELENERTYPRVVRQQLHALGLSSFFIDSTIEAVIERETTEPQPATWSATFPHLVALISLCTAATGSLGITVGVNMLALNGRKDLINGGGFFFFFFFFLGANWGKRVTGSFLVISIKQNILPAI